jgi:hypothetical protein
MYEHHPSLRSSRAGLSSSSERALLAARELVLDFVETLLEAAGAVLERKE